MFSSLGLFKNTPCPCEDNCQLSYCLFSHDAKVGQEKLSQAISQNKGQRHSSPKRRKLNNFAESGDQSKEKLFSSEKVAHQQDAEATGSHSLTAVRNGEVQTHAEASKKRKGQDGPQAPEKDRPISPPPLKKVADTKTQNRSNQQKESLNPRKIKSSPASHSTRNLYLKTLYEKFKAINGKLALLEDKEAKSLCLSEQQLITLALDEEEKAAIENPSIYCNVIKNRILTVSKMTVDQWNLERKEDEVSKSSKKSKNPGAAIDTGLSSKQEIQILRHLIHKEKALTRYGFLTSVPTEVQIAKAREGVTTALGWEQCDRCKSRFQVFVDGSSEDQPSRSGDSCVYHPGRIETSKALGGAEQKMFNCCNAALGSSPGCTTANSHVFKVEEPARLASIFQYSPTMPKDGGGKEAVSFDCEMGYTVYGMELIRLTVLSWPEGDLILDVLVKPFGRILDLNTRYSGVQQKDYEAAVPYKMGRDSAHNGNRLKVVGSPKEAQQLFFDSISNNTILVGHSLENDLNAARIVHTDIVDSTILFPHQRGPPYRHALKRLAKDVLDRDIQMGMQGHDPQEDAKTAGDLVRYKVAKKWKQLKTDGWTFKHGVLISPKERMNQTNAAHDLRDEQ